MRNILILIAALSFVSEVGWSEGATSAPPSGAPNSQLTPEQVLNQPFVCDQNDQNHSNCSSDSNHIEACRAAILNAKKQSKTIMDGMGLEIGTGSLSSVKPSGPVSVMCGESLDKAHLQQLKINENKAKVDNLFKSIEPKCNRVAFFTAGARAVQQNLIQAAKSIKENHDGEFVNLNVSLEDQVASYNKCMDHWKLGGKIAAGVGAVALGVAAYDRHQDAKHRAALANDVNNAIIHNADGTTTDCKQTTTYSTNACQPALITYCSKSQNSGQPGCGAFASYYCGSNPTSSFCMANSARTYCQNPGALTGQSPACQWYNNLPSICSTDPSNVQCLSPQSPAQLATACPNFPSDPLCAQYNSGAIVTQPGATGAAVSSGAFSGANGSATLTSTSRSAAPAAANTNLFKSSSQGLQGVCSNLLNCSH